jgi:hypothetical protein
MTIDSRAVFVPILVWQKAIVGAPQGGNALDNWTKKFAIVTRILLWLASNSVLHNGNQPRKGDTKRLHMV